MTINNNHIEAFTSTTDSLVNADYTGHFKMGCGDLVFRDDLPMLQFSASLNLDEVQGQVDVWNRFIRESLPGHGYYTPNPSADISDSDYHHFGIISDDAFYDAFKESMTHEDIVDLPSNLTETDDQALDFSAEAYDSFMSKM